MNVFRLDFLITIRTRTLGAERKEHYITQNEFQKKRDLPQGKYDAGAFFGAGDTGICGRSFGD